MLRAIVLSAVCAVLVAAGADPLAGSVITPFGRVHRDCVHYAPKDSVIVEKDEHTELHHADGRIEKYAPCDFFDPRKKVGSEMPSVLRSTEAGAFDLEGWIDYTGWYPANSGYKVPITSFTGYNTVPDTPSNTKAQTLYWFIGMQNNEDSAVRILQPVLTFNGVGGGASGAPQGWSFMSWNCCPKGQVWYSDPVTDFKPGDVVYGEVVSKDGGKTYSITSKSATNSTTLTISATGVTGSPLTFDWADVTLEVYSVTDCKQFPTKSIEFLNMTLSNVANQTLTPSWTVYKGSTCNDGVTVVDPLDVTIAAHP